MPARSGRRWTPALSLAADCGPVDLMGMRTDPLADPTKKRAPTNRDPLTAHELPETAHPSASKRALRSRCDQNGIAAAGAIR